MCFDIRPGSNHLKPGMLTGTSKAPPRRNLVPRLVARGRKIVGGCGRCCKPIRSGLGETMNERRPLYWFRQQPLGSAPLLSFEFLYSRIQLRFFANLIYWNHLFVVIWFSQPFVCTWRQKHLAGLDTGCALDHSFPPFLSRFTYVWVCPKFWY